MNICASDDDRRVGKLQQPAGRWTPHHLCLLTIKLQPVRPHPAVHVINTFCDVGRQSRCGIRLAGTIYLTVIGMYCRETVKCHIELGHLIYDSVVKQSGWLPAELLVLLAGSGLPIKLAVSCSQICRRIADVKAAFGVQLAHSCLAVYMQSVPRGQQH